MLGEILWPKLYNSYNNILFFLLLSMFPRLWITHSRLFRGCSIWSIRYRLRNVKHNITSIYITDVSPKIQKKMSLFRFQWLRNFIRRNTNYIPEEKALFWKKKLSLVYALVAWNAFGFVVYMIYTGKSDWAKKYKTPEELSLTPAQQWSRTLGIKDAKVYSVSGLNVTKYEIHNTFDEASNNVTGDEAVQE